MKMLKLNQKITSLVLSLTPLFGSAVMIPLAVATIPLVISQPAQADTSCNALLEDLANHLRSPLGLVSLQHMTNYQANGQWWGGYTQVPLLLRGPGAFSRVGDDYLVGSGGRLLSSRSVRVGGGFGIDQPFNIYKADPMSYKISLKRGTITFQDKYGPYDMSCLGTKFLVVNTGDSIETFSFNKTIGPK